MHQVEEQNKDFQKIIVVGDASTGKTNIIYTFLREKPPNNIMPTVAVQFSSKAIQLDNLRKAKAQIWDTAGQQVYRSLTMNHYRNANGALIIFDVSRRSTFEHVSYWLQNLRQKGDANIEIGLIGHKIDSSRREVTTLQAEQFASKQHLFYCQTTINDVSSINTVFKKLLTNIINNQIQQKTNGNQFRLEQGHNENSGCSC